jgi:hypothetical protein
MGAEFIWRKLGEHGSRHADFAVGQKSDPPKIRRLKSVLSEFVINYGLKSAAWFVFGCVTNCDPACKRVGVQACKRAWVQGCIKVRSAE